MTALDALKTWCVEDMPFRWAASDGLESYIEVRWED